MIATELIKILEKLPSDVLSKRIAAGNVMQRR